MAATTTMKLPPGLGVYVFLEKARPPKTGTGAPKFSLVLLYPKSDAGKLDELRRVMLEVANAEWPGKGADVIRRMKNPIPGDGDAYYAEDPEKREPFKGMVYVRMSSVRRPGIGGIPEGEDKLRALYPEELNAEAYSGCTFKASVGISAYDKGGNKGVGVYVNNLIVLAKGTRLAGGGVSVEEDFADEFGGGSTAGKPATKKNPWD